MNKEQLFEAIGEVDDSLVEQAAVKQRRKGRIFHFRPAAWVAAAACCLVVGTAILGLPKKGMGAAGADTVSNATASSTQEAGGAGPEYAMDMVTEDAAPGAAVMDGSAQNSTAKLAEVTTQKVIYTAELEMESTQYEETLAQLLAKVEEMGGYQESSTQGGSLEYGTRWYNASFRIPSDRYEEFLSSAQGVGNVTWLSQDSQDVTLEYVDLEARISSLETQRQRLDELAAQAETVEDLIYIQGQLSSLEYQLESYGSQMRVLENQVSMSTVTVRLSEVATITPVTNSFASRVSDAFTRGWTGFLDGIQGLILGIISVWPVLLLAAVLVVVIIIIRKKRISKNNK